jgi:WD40 repeat protein
VCALSDGRRVVSGSDDNTVRVWDVETRACVLVLTGHDNVSEVQNDRLNSFLFLPVGHQFVSLAGWSSDFRILGLHDAGVGCGQTLGTKE